ncbi:hypothetical protein ES703_103918 [subsurface metagenome]
MIAKVGNITENLVADRTDLDGDVPFFHDLHEERMLKESDAVADSFGVKQNGIKHVFVFCPVAFARMNV